MSTVKWETIQKRCCKKAVEQLSNPFNFELSGMKTLEALRMGTTTNKNLPILIEKAKEIINQWDVRSFRALQKVFPECFPKKTITEITMNEECDWVLVY